MSFSINESGAVKVTIAPSWSVLADKVKSIVNFKAKATSKDDAAYFDMLSLTDDEERVILDILHSARAELMSMMRGFNRHFKVKPVELSTSASEQEKAKAKYAFDVFLHPIAASRVNPELLTPIVSEYYVNHIISEWLSTLGRYEDGAFHKKKADEFKQELFLAMQTFVTANRVAKELNL